MISNGTYITVIEYLAEKKNIYRTFRPKIAIFVHYFFFHLREIGKSNQAISEINVGYIEIPH